MSLRPPTNYTNAILAASIGVAVGLLIHFVRRNELPHSGDNIHHLPYGGQYMDGTKCINYNRGFGGRNFSLLGTSSNSGIWLLLLTTGLLLYVTRSCFARGGYIYHSNCHIHRTV
ncbi:TGB2 [Robigovirus elaeis]|uniref:Movement protein TGB2 n=1 Tax=Robigovirus elaeis TaxID=185218 RepID=C1BEG0_9VIRU|nr:TGB2 [African oil palm ringspot virus]ACO38637.1 TGB2 [African oil palm ringspot virus]